MSRYSAGRCGSTPGGLTTKDPSRGSERGRGDRAEVCRPGTRWQGTSLTGLFRGEDLSPPEDEAQDREYDDDNDDPPEQSAERANKQVVHAILLAFLR